MKNLFIALLIIVFTSPAMADSIFDWTEDTTPGWSDYLLGIDDLTGTRDAVKVPYSGIYSHVDTEAEFETRLFEILTPSDVQDTPTNGETDTPVSSNALYDHANASDPHTGYMLESNIGTGASNYVQLNASGELPAVSGANLTNLPGGLGVDDTPTNGDTTDAISSNWAYDFTASSGTARTRDAEDSLTNGSNLPDGAAVKDYVDTVVREEFIPVSWVVLDGTADPSDEAETTNLRYRDFDSSSLENCEFIWQVPAGITGTTVKVRAIGLITSATAPTSGQGVSWELKACSSGTGDDHDCAGGTAVNSEIADLSAHVQDDVVYFPYVEITPTDLAGGELGNFYLARDVSDTEDDYTQDIGLIGVMIKWQENRSTLTY